jgi:isopenicillin N synthase-like dioxygenase
MSVQVIDISAWIDYASHSNEERSLVVQQWDQAFSSFGFVAITGTVQHYSRYKRINLLNRSWGRCGVY